MSYIDKVKVDGEDYDISSTKLIAELDRNSENSITSTGLYYVFGDGVLEDGKTYYLVVDSVTNFGNLVFMFNFNSTYGAFVQDFIFFAGGDLYKIEASVNTTTMSVSFFMYIHTPSLEGGWTNTNMTEQLVAMCDTAKLKIYKVM